MCCIIPFPNYPLVCDCTLKFSPDPKQPLSFRCYSLLVTILYLFTILTILYLLSILTILYLLYILYPYNPLFPFVVKVFYLQSFSYYLNSFYVHDLVTHNLSPYSFTSQPLVFSRPLVFLLPSVPRPDSV